jgi:ABC-type branched-subunit amino acid transport system substrate-binding protein
MGGYEGDRAVPALAGPVLLAPDRRRGRPAYTEASLAAALRDGVDPAGRRLDRLMPRYTLEDDAIASLFAYLGRLGSAPSPGVGAASVHLATVVAGDVPAASSEAVLGVMKAFLEARNRSAPQRRRGGHGPGEPREALREWSLDVWRLGGPPETWQGQLEAHMRERPAFALVGGIGSTTWQPVHEFCEAAGVPCILPVVDLPPPDDGAHYSFYFTRGLRLEAEIAAATIAAEDVGSGVVQVIGSSTAAAAAAREFANAVEERGGRARTVRLGDDPAVLSQGAPAVLWLTGDEIGSLAGRARADGPPLLLSSTLLGDAAAERSSPIRDRGRLIRLSAPPGEPDPALDRFRAWARARGIPARNERVQALAYYAVLTLSDALKHAGAFVQRDHLVDLLDHASAMSAYLPLYTRASMTPGQRVLSRGGWVVDLSGRVEPRWLVP